MALTASLTGFHEHARPGGSSDILAPTLQPPPSKGMASKVRINGVEIPMVANRAHASGSHYTADLASMSSAAAQARNVAPGSVARTVPHREPQNKRTKGAISVHISAAATTAAPLSSKTIRRTVKAGVLRNIQTMLAQHPQAATMLLDDGTFALHVAAEFHAGKQGQEIIDVILAADPAAVTKKDFAGRTPLHLCVSHGDPSEVTIRKLCAPAAAAITDIEGLLPLHRLLISSDNEQALQYLLQANPRAASVRCAGPGSTAAGGVGHAVNTSKYSGSVALHLMCQGPCGASAAAVKSLLDVYPEAVSMPCPSLTAAVKSAAGATNMLSGLMPVHILSLFHADAHASLALVAEAYKEACLHRVLDGQMPLLMLASHHPLAAPSLGVLTKVARAAALHQDASGRTALHYVCNYAGTHSLAVTYLRRTHGQRQDDGQTETQSEDEGNASDSGMQPMTSRDSWRVGAGGGLRSSVLNLDEAMASASERSQSREQFLAVSDDAKRERRRKRKEDRLRRQQRTLRKEWKLLSDSMEVLLQAGVGAASLQDKDANTPVMLAAANSAFPGGMLTRLLKSCPNACSVLNLHSRTVLHELCCNRATTIEAIDVATSAHDAAALKGDSEGNTPLHLLCQFNGDRPDLMKKLLAVQHMAARSTNKDGQLPLHVLCVNFGHDDYLESLQMLLTSFPEGAEVADDFGCLAVDLIGQEAKQHGVAQHLVHHLVEAIEVDISVDGKDLVRPTVHPTPLSGKEAGTKAARVFADTKLREQACRCDQIETDGELETKQSRLLDVQLLDSLKKLRLPIGHEHTSEQFWQNQLIRGSHERIAGGDDENDGSGAMQAWHPDLAPSSKETRRQPQPLQVKSKGGPEGKASRRGRMQAAAAAHRTDWGGGFDPNQDVHEDRDDHPVYLCSGKVRKNVPPGLESLNLAIKRSSQPAKRRNRSASRDPTSNRRRSRGRSRPRGLEVDNGAAVTIPATQRGRRAPSDVKAAGMMSGRMPVTEWMHKQITELGHVHVAALDQQAKGGGNERKDGRQSLVSSSRRRHRSVETLAISEATQAAQEKLLRQYVPASQAEYNQRLSQIDFTPQQQKRPSTSACFGSADVSPPQNLGLASTSGLSNLLSSVEIVSDTIAGPDPISVDAAAGFRHGTQERFEGFEPLWSKDRSTQDKTAEIMSEMEAWNKLCGEEASLLGASQYTEQTRQSRRKSRQVGHRQSHSPDGHTDQAIHDLRETLRLESAGQDQGLVAVSPTQKDVAKGRVESRAARRASAARRATRASCARSSCEESSSDSQQEHVVRAPTLSFARDVAIHHVPADVMGSSRLVGMDTGGSSDTTGSAVSPSVVCATPSSAGVGKPSASSVTRAAPVARLKNVLAAATQDTTFKEIADSIQKSETDALAENKIPGSRRSTQPKAGAVDRLKGIFDQEIAVQEVASKSGQRTSPQILGTAASPQQPRHNATSSDEGLSLDTSAAASATPSSTSSPHLRPNDKAAENMADTAVMSGNNNDGSAGLDAVSRLKRVLAEKGVEDASESSVTTTISPQVSAKRRSVPKDLLCPISHQLMRNPVVAQDGFTYEREEIENWFAQCRKQNERDSEGAGAPSITSPMTGAAMATTLSPNLLARSLIRKLKERNPGLN